TVGYTVREIRPSRSRPRSVWVSTFCVTPSTRRRSSENRSTSSDDNALMTSIVHFSATRPRTWRLGHSALMTFHRQTRAGVVSIRYLYHKNVPSSVRQLAFLSLPKQHKDRRKSDESRNTYRPNGPDGRTEKCGGTRDQASRGARRGGGLLT